MSANLVVIMVISWVSCVGLGLVLGYSAGCHTSSAREYRAYFNGVRSGHKEAADKIAAHNERLAGAGGDQ